MNPAGDVRRHWRRIVEGSSRAGRRSGKLRIQCVFFIIQVRLGWASRGWLTAVVMERVSALDPDLRIFVERKVATAHPISKTQCPRRQGTYPGRSPLAERGSGGVDVATPVAFRVWGISMAIGLELLSRGDRCGGENVGETMSDPLELRLSGVFSRVGVFGPDGTRGSDWSSTMSDVFEYVLRKGVCRGRIWRERAERGDCFLSDLPRLDMICANGESIFNFLH